MPGQLPHRGLWTASHVQGIYQPSLTFTETAAHVLLSCWSSPARSFASDVSASAAAKPKGPSKLLNGRTSLAIAGPELAKSWHPTRNGSLTPDDVCALSNRKRDGRCPFCFPNGTRQRAWLEKARKAEQGSQA
ncbi:hypothetical protein WJX72_001502 [[Myrmecia] bisecta]|uniref:Uncharacterized protein n=1 Tax=[Myrmecia] bisecta TaxID=41462 RepID=A0AAW1R5A7_9CHLO